MSFPKKMLRGRRIDISDPHWGQIKKALCKQEYSGINQGLQ